MLRIQRVRTIVYATVALLVVSGSLAWPRAGLQFVSDSVATQLVGGADCANYMVRFCPAYASATSGCPANGGFGTATTGNDAKPSGSQWCGCVTSCANRKIVKGIVQCGSM